MLYESNTAIDTAEDIVIVREINGEYSLSFFLPWGDPYVAQIDEGTVIRETYYKNQDFIVEKIEKEKSANAGYRYFARHVYFAAEKKFIPAFAHRNGESAADIFAAIWANTGFAVLSGTEIVQLGMTPVTTLTDFDDKDKTDPISLTQALIKAVGQGEIYIDNKTVALVEDIGEAESRLSISLTANADSITVAKDISGVVTRLYPFGKNDLDITDVVGVAYVDSPNIDLNNIKEGYLDFTELSDPDILYARALWQFDSDNPNRIDVPYITISCKFTDLSGIDGNIDAPLIGQSVSCEGYTDKRIIKLTQRPLQPENTDIVIGQIKKDLFYFFKRFNNAAIDVETGNVNITNNAQNVAQITNITKQEVVAADMIEATAAFIDDLQIERLETNLKNFICLPNITVVNDTPQWVGNTRTWHAKTGYTGANIRGYIKTHGMTNEYIEAHLTVPSDPTAIEAADLEAVQVNGRQLYFTSIAGAQAFEYLTFTAPGAKYQGISSDIAAMYVVYKRKTATEYVKAKNEFEWDSANSTYNIKTTYGVGDANGRGVYTFIKDADSGRFTYKSRTDGLEYGIVEKDNGTFVRVGGVDVRAMACQVFNSYADAAAAAATAPNLTFGVWRT